MKQGQTLLRLKETFEIYENSEQIDFFITNVGAWLMNGRYDGKPNTKLD